MATLGGKRTLTELASAPGNHLEPIPLAGPVVDRKDAKGREMWKHKYGLHDLRHACASRWIRQKIDLKRLTTWLGHSSVQISLDIYGHLIEDEQEDAAIVAASAAELLP